MDPSQPIIGGYRRYGYGQPLGVFLGASNEAIVGALTQHSAFDVDQTQVAAWVGSIAMLRVALAPWAHEGHLFLEFDVPRLGRRIDAVLVLRHVVFVIEFKVGAKAYLAQDLDQVVDYALDLKHFHETSHHVPMAPMLVSTAAQAASVEASMDSAVPHLLHPMRCNSSTLAQGIAVALELTQGQPVDAIAWVRGRYRPTPTIVEAAMALYARHSVADISRSDAANLGQTSGFVNGLIARAREQGTKAICFVTGVPGAGKTPPDSGTPTIRRRWWRPQSGTPTIPGAIRGGTPAIWDAIWDTHNSWGDSGTPDSGTPTIRRRWWRGGDRTRLELSDRRKRGQRHFPTARTR